MATTGWCWRGRRHRSRGCARRRGRARRLCRRVGRRRGSGAGGAGIWSVLSPVGGVLGCGWAPRGWCWLWSSPRWRWRCSAGGSGRTRFRESAHILVGGDGGGGGDAVCVGLWSGMRPGGVVAGRRITPGGVYSLAVTRVGRRVAWHSAVVCAPSVVIKGEKSRY